MYQLPPPKVLQINLLRLDPLENWGSEPFPDQPWVFEADLLVTPQVHSDYRTPTPGIYNGLDVHVGDYFSTQSGKMLLITEIQFQDEDQITCTVEDKDRSNSSIDSASVGESAIQLGTGILFTVRKGTPILFPMPAGLVSVTDRDLIDIIGRFAHTDGAPGASVGQLDDVDLTNITDGSVLVYNSELGIWQPTLITEHSLDGGEY